VNILDENIPKSQASLLESWRIHFKQIGVNVGRLGMSDQEIIPLLLKQNRPTFFTRDQGFYDSRLCHAGYCLVFLAVGKNEVASFIRRLLSHPSFRTRAMRMGSIVRVSRAKISVVSTSTPHHEIKFGWFTVV
jgi:hypothetical protein